MIRRATRRVLGNAAATVDRAVTRGVFVRTSRGRGRSAAESLGHEQRLQGLAMLAAAYEGVGEDGYFRPSRAIEPSMRRVRQLSNGGTVFDLAWRSDYSTFLPDLDERYDRPDNRIAAARLSLHREPHPVALCVHGYLGGNYGLEERAFPVRWLYRIGFDVGLFVLPFHGVRADPRRSTPPFPGADPRITNEGFRQAMADLGDLMGWLRGRGHPSVGVMGMSLGGYTTALAVTVFPELSFGVPIIPLASFADIARDQGRLGRNPTETAAQHAALERVHRVISPLHRRPVVDSKRLLVLGAKADQITPIHHARQLAHHFGAPLETWPGGHLLQFGRGEGFRRFGRLVNELGIVSRHAR